MARALREIEEEIRSLSAEDQTRLLRALVAVLDEGVDEDVERAWIEEAQRRHRELIEGSVKAVPVDEVIAKARARLRDEG